MAAKQPTKLEEESYRVHFFIVASIIMGTMVWLVYQEFVTRRPWKDHQIAWFDVEKTRAKKNLDSERKFVESGTIVVKDEAGEETEVQVAERIKALDTTIAELEGKVRGSERYKELMRLEAELPIAEQRLKDQETKVAFAKADEDEYYYYYRDAKHHGDAAGEKKFLADLERIQAHVAEEAKKYDDETAKRDGITDRIGAIRKELNDAKRELSQLEGGLENAKRTFDAADTTWTARLTQLEIYQYWNQDIELVDRCHTCHMGADKCGYTYPKEILEDAVMAIVKTGAEINVEEFRKKYCITREEAQAYVASAEEVADSLGEDDALDFEKVKDKLDLAGEPVLSTAKELEVEAKSAEQVFRTHPYRNVLLKKHPGQQFGCTTCHYGEGRRTKGVGLNYLAADNPHSNPRAVFDHARRDHYWLSQMLDNTKHHTEASCFNCHQGDYELEQAPHYTEARKLVTHLGCTGCHPLGPLDAERKHGPPLLASAAKMNPSWMIQWIEHPKALRPHTRMPNFWPEVTRKAPEGERPLVCNEFDYAKGSAVQPAVAEDCAEKRNREVGYVTAYLMSKSKEATYPEMPATASADKGKELFETVGCQACHNLGAWDGASHMPGSAERDHAPNLTNIGDKIKTPGWFFSWVKNPKSYWPDTKMPSLRLTDEEAWNIAAFLSSQRSGDAREVPAAIQKHMDAPDAVEKGKTLIAWYGCFGCHDIEGFEDRGRIGADLTAFGSKLPHKLDFGDVPEFVADHHEQTWANWTHRKLADPRVYRYERVETRMPQFDLSEHEIAQITLFLKSQNEETTGWPADIKSKLNDQRRALQRGALLVDHYNCRGCHQIDDRGLDIDGDGRVDGGDIYKWFAAHEDEKFRAPPRLMNLGRKLYPDWLYGFLKAPFKLRENYKIRMPTFQFSDQVAADFVAYFSAKAGEPYPYIEKKIPPMGAEDAVVASQLFEAAQCLKCHNLTGVSNDPKAIAPNLRLTAPRLKHDWLFDWLADPQKQIPGVAMPGFYYVDESTGKLQTPLPAFAGGDAERQISLLRAYVISLGANAAVASAGAGSGTTLRQ